MNDFRQTPDIRVLRKKEVADIMTDVLKDKADMLEIEASLHSLFAKYDKTQEADREVLHRVLHSSVVLARAMNKIIQEVSELKSAGSPLDTIK